MRKISLLLLLQFISLNIQAQSADTTEKVNDELLSYGILNYDAEYYTIDSKNSFLEHHFIYQPFLSKSTLFNIEFGLVHSFLESGEYFVPADLSINFQQNFKSRKYKSSGFQGLSTKLKFTMPTGKDEYYSGFDSWSIEPLFGVQWLLKNTNWLAGGQLRYNYSFAALPGKSPRYSFLRLDFYIGFESGKWWMFLEPDYRYIPSRESQNLFLNVDMGYKFSRKFGVHINGKPRLIGSDFFESQYTLGLYYYF